MKELLNKYPALELPRLFVEILGEKVDGEKDKETFYKVFKANISCIGLEPAEYETCIKWFCETMKY